MGGESRLSRLSCRFCLQAAQRSLTLRLGRTFVPVPSALPPLGVRRLDIKATGHHPLGELGGAEHDAPGGRTPS